MLNSLLMSFGPGMPIDIKNPNITKLILTFMPEIATFYGKDVVIELIL